MWPRRESKERRSIRLSCKCGRCQCTCWMLLQRRLLGSGCCHSSISLLPGKLLCSSMPHQFPWASCAKWLQLQCWLLRLRDSYYTGSFLHVHMLASVLPSQFHWGPCSSRMLLQCWLRWICICFNDESLLCHVLFRCGLPCLLQWS